MRYKYLFAGGALLFGNLTSFGLAFYSLHNFPSQPKSHEPIEQKSYPSLCETLYGHLIDYNQYITTVGEVVPSNGYTHYRVPDGESIESIYVRSSMQVREGTLLYRLDNRALVKELEEAKKAYINEQMALEKLIAPLSEEALYVAKKAVEVQKALVEEQQKEVLLYQSIDPLAMPPLELNRVEMQLKVKMLQLEQKEAECALLQKGAPTNFISVQESKVKIEQARVERIEKALQERDVVVKESGVIIAADKQGVILANVDVLDLKVAIDVRDLGKFSPQLKALAFDRSNEKQIPLHFLYLEPTVEVKDEGVGALHLGNQRVVFAHFALDQGDKKLFLGQLLDVYLQTD